MDRAGLKSFLRSTAEYFGLAGEVAGEEATDRVGSLETQVEALERRVAQQAEDIEFLRAELIRVRGKLQD